MSNESTEFTIRNFIDNRWYDAKRELSIVDRDFVSEVESIVRTQNLGLVLPSGLSLPTPTFRLSSKWHDLLALTMEVVEELDRLNLTVTLMDPNNSHGIDRRLGVYYFDVWIQRVFNLCEKLDKLVANTCRLLLRNKKPDKWRAREDYYRALIKAKVQDEIEKHRSPSVHGAGGQGILSGRVITEDHQGWEISVVGGPQMIDIMMEERYQAGGLLDPEGYFQIAGVLTQSVVVNLTTILLELDQELAQANFD